MHATKTAFESPDLCRLRSKSLRSCFSRCTHLEQQFAAASGIKSGRRCRPASSPVNSDLRSCLSPAVRLMHRVQQWPPRPQEMPGPLHRHVRSGLTNTASPQTRAGKEKPCRVETTPPAGSVGPPACPGDSLSLCVCARSCSEPTKTHHILHAGVRAGSCARAAVTASAGATPTSVLVIPDPKALPGRAGPRWTLVE